AQVADDARLVGPARAAAAEDEPGALFGSVGRQGVHRRGFSGTGFTLVMSSSTAPGRRPGGTPRAGEAGGRPVGSGLRSVGSLETASWRYSAETSTLCGSSSSTSIDGAVPLAASGLRVGGGVLSASNPTGGRALAAGRPGGAGWGLAAGRGDDGAGVGGGRTGTGGSVLAADETGTMAWDCVGPDSSSSPSSSRSRASSRSLRSYAAICWRSAYGSACPFSRWRSDGTQRCTKSSDTWWAGGGGTPCVAGSKKRSSRSVKPWARRRWTNWGTMPVGAWKPMERPRSSFPSAEYTQMCCVR